MSSGQAGVWQNFIDHEEVKDLLRNLVMWSSHRCGSYSPRKKGEERGDITRRMYAHKIRGLSFDTDQGEKCGLGLSGVYLE